MWAVRRSERRDARVRVLLTGDVMTGRGIDQILPHPGDPTLHEPYVEDAREYVALAERANGPIARPVAFASIWGTALADIARRAPDARIANLETSVTTSDDFDEAKEIHYRMHPANAPVLAAAGFDVAVLANNHVLDWGTAGLVETLDVLHRAGIATAGAGRDRREAERPAVIARRDAAGRVLVFGLGDASSGVASTWRAEEHAPGVARLDDLSDESADRVCARVAEHKREGDVAIASIHWGSNWGYDVPREQARFARRLLDGPIDVVHGHSSHHPRPIEIHRGKLALYGCGDLVNDYEGIEGYAAFRGDLALLYFADVDPASGALVELAMRPLRVRRMRLEPPPDDDVAWLARRLDAISRPFGTRVERLDDATLVAIAAAVADPRLPPLVPPSARG
jgi:poly-gamma-glutamate capsule biosynthesis protein CapA/YwtB (metallophosphatase superfamily)